MNETIHILLPVHNRREITRRFIQCLKDQSYSQYHLILLDDGSTDGTAQMVRDHIQSLTVITGDGTWWWAGALQHGYKLLKKLKPPLSDIVLIINDDTEFEPDFLEKALTVLRKRPRTFVLAQCYSRQNGRLIDAGIHINWAKFTFEQPSMLKPINCLSTRGLFFRVEDFFIVGGFHPKLLRHYGSDYEFTIRAQRKCMRLMTDPSVVIRIDESTTGYHDVEGNRLLGALKTVFTAKSAINPLTLSVFVALACPWPWKFTCWYRIVSLSLSRGLALLTGRISTR